MKKKSLLFLLLMALFAPWAVTAQETLTVYGDGTTTTNNYVPIYGLYCDEGVKCEFVIPAEQLEGMANGTISAMKFYLASVGYNTINPSFTIFVKEVDFTTMTAYTGTSGATTVFNSTFTFTTGTTNVEIEVPFSEDYTYEGGNLLIGVYQNGTSGYSSLGWTGVSQNYNAAWRGYGSSSGSAQQFLPKTTFTYTPGEAPACAKPTNLTMSSIYSSAATISWESPANSFYFFYKKTTEEWPDYDPIEVNGRHDFTMAELEPNTTYDVRVKALCSVDPWEESPYATTQFTTACGDITSFPWTEDFESYASGNFTDACWVNEHISGSGTSIFKVYTSANGNNSTHQLQLPDQSDGTLTKLVLPEMTLPGDNYEFVIDVYRNSSYSSKTGEGIRVFASTNGEIEGATELAFIPRVNTVESGIIPAEDAAGWYTYELPIGISGTCYIILRGENQYGTSTYMDNFKVKRIPTCLPPTGLHVAEVTAHSVRIEWDAEEDVMFQALMPGGQPTYPFDPTTPPTNWNVQPQTENFAVWDDLTPETTYGVWLRKYCGTDDQSDPIYIMFTTAEACPVPTNLAASNLTQNTADLSWTGSVDVEGYDVWFRRAEQIVGINEQFNTSTLDLEGWEVKTGLLSDIIAGGELSVWASPYWDCGTYNGVFDSHARLNIWGQGCKSWLITPRHTVKSGDTFTFDLALTAYSGTSVPTPATNGTDDRFVVLIGYNNGQNWEILREWNNSGSQYVYNDIANSATGEQVSIDLTEYVGCDVRIAFYGESTVSNADNNLHIDNVKIGTEYAAGGDNFVESYTTNVQLVGLEANTIYDVQVRSKCSDTWTDIFNFKTLDQNTKVFIGGQPLDDYDLEEVSDKWWNPNNWVPYGMPGAVNDSPNEDVILRHDAVISINLITGRNIIADANSITFEGTPKPTLTLEDGNQLRLNTEIDQPDVITVKKNIIGYAGTKDQYYLISSPVQWAGQYNPANGIVTTESDYDLYAFDPAASDGLEWRNYKADPTNFKMDWGTGYLYANAADVMISVTGPVMDNKQPDEIFNYNYFENEDYQFNGWKLCGNTFTCNAYLSSDSQTMAFYRMNAEGTGFEAVTSVIKPMEGFFLQNTVNGKSVVLSRTAPSKGVRCLNLVLSQVAAHRDGVSTGSTTLDNAIVRFDEGNTLEKLSFREGSSKIYMPVEGKDYAVVNAGQMGELPVSFKAEKNGSYTLSFTNEDVEFSYLHLIDNLTGNDVDLLTHPSYSFNASTTDYASRFRLVFATGTSVEGDSFSFVNASGNLCIFGIEGEATVQVIDILGHVISSETFSGSYERKINGAPGVYMVRLINGNDVKVQKVVVR